MLHTFQVSLANFGQRRWGRRVRKNQNKIMKGKRNVSKVFFFYDELKSSSRISFFNNKPRNTNNFLKTGDTLMCIKLNTQICFVLLSLFLLFNWFFPFPLIPYSFLVPHIQAYKPKQGATCYFLSLLYAFRKAQPPLIQYRQLMDKECTYILAQLERWSGWERVKDIVAHKHSERNRGKKQKNRRGETLL